jgi:hypothetical protein
MHQVKLASGMVRDLQRGDESARACRGRAEEVRFAEVPGDVTGRPSWLARRA